MDAKLQEILLDYGLEGYGLYWYCLELVAQNVTSEKLTFELEHDCRIIARNTGSTDKKVQEIMSRFIELELFNGVEGRIVCLNLAKRCDDFTAKAIRRTGVQPLKLGESDKLRQTPTLSEKVPLEVEVEVEVEKNTYKHIDLSEMPIELSLTEIESFIDYKTKRSVKKKEPAPTTRAIKMSLNQAVIINKTLNIDFETILATVEEKGWLGIKLDYFTVGNQFNQSAVKPKSKPFPVG